MTYIFWQFANGPSGQGVDDLFTPDIQAYFNSGDPNATEEVIPFDKTHTDAVVNWINGRTALGTPFPANKKGFVVGANFQAVSVAQKAWQPTWNFTQGGYADAMFTPSAVLDMAFKSVDRSVGRIVDALKTNGLWNSTLVILTAKHGQAPVNKSTNQNVGNPDGIITKFGGADWTNDDSLMIWYHDQSVAAPSCQSPPPPASISRTIASRCTLLALSLASTAEPRWLPSLGRTQLPILRLQTLL